ncbi:ficolin-1-like [Ostrea edulis]|uniref:ficolin-1-like n=1 Tax=Ostrea edulis TaxID=37623 RepID=UPI0024AFE0CA|nr:ficolin-1-like [Ostrea edulis]
MEAVGRSFNEGGIFFFLDFRRNWTEYKQGFGDPSKEYWIGNDAINALTSTKDQELRIVLRSYRSGEKHAQYSTFYVGDEESKYNLTVSGYSGTVDDSLTSHNGMRFSTYDNDNDKDCARLFHGGWWYSDCGDSDLNRNYETIFGFRGAMVNARGGVTWLLGTVMMTRPKSS